MTIWKIWFRASPVCRACVANMYKGEPICCLVNPFLGHEAQGYPKAEKSEKVMVIGGGVAGMCAAFVAAERGHDVSLYESTDKLGGNMRLAAYPPGKGDITNMIRSYIVRCEKAGVKIHMNTTVDLEMVKSRKTGCSDRIYRIKNTDPPYRGH